MNDYGLFAEVFISFKVSSRYLIERGKKVYAKLSMSMS
jgi:hypothetical protein